MAQKQKDNRKPQIWQPGQSGNPKGRPPKGQAIADILRNISQEHVELDDKYVKWLQIERESEDTPVYVTAKEAMLIAAYYQAVKENDRDARNFIAERTEGKIVAPVSLESKEPFKIQIVAEDDAKQTSG